MAPEVILGLIVIVPVVVLLLLRVNATLVFLSLCLGSVLVQFVGNDPDSISSLLSSTGASQAIQASDNNLKLFLLLTPVILTTIFMIKTIHGNARMALNILPAIGVGVLGALLVVPLLPPGTAYGIIESDIWQQILNIQNIIVGGTAIVCLIVLWLQRPKTGHSKHHKKHKS